MRTFIVLFLALLLSGGAALAQAGKPLDADKAFALSASGSEQGTVFTWTVAPGYYLYRDHFSIAVDGAPVDHTASPGQMKDDPGFGRVEVLHDKADVTIAPRAGLAEVTYQGCQEDGICYPVQTKTVDLRTLAVLPAGAASSQLTFAPTPQDAPQLDPLAAAGIEIANDADAGSSLLADASLAWVIASFLGFGLLLAFTPCVFPIYPIVLGMLGRQSAAADARQGLLLSAVYVAALASAFALVGAAVGWTGQNLQYYLQSPTTTVVLAAIFLLLALSSFGRFDIRLPGFITDRAASLKGRSGTVVSAAALGFTSSLIVGPCVTAPLAGALLYIGQGGDWRIGAIALFALGVGKGLPLIALATFGGGLLPKAGAWMESIRRLFGFGFAAMAVWTLSPLLPPNVDLALYLAIVGLAGVDLLMRLKTARRVSAALVLTATAPAMALFAGAPEADARIVLSTPAEPALDFAQTDSLPGLVKAFEAAKGRPVLVYVTAQWCVICRSIDRSVLPDERVVAALSGAHLVKLDVTDYGPEAQAMLARLKVAGPPTMLFFDGARREISGSRLIGKVSVDQLAAAAETLLN